VISPQRVSGTEAVRRAGKESGRRNRASVHRYEVMYRIVETEHDQRWRAKAASSGLGRSSRAASRPIH